MKQCMDVAQMLYFTKYMKGNCAGGGGGGGVGWGGGGATITRKGEGRRNYGNHMPVLERSLSRE